MDAEISTSNSVQRLRAHRKAHYALFHRRLHERKEMQKQRIKENQERSFFLSMLPPEVRGLIYQFALADHIIDCDRINNRWKPQENPLVLVLPQVSHQVYYETASVVFRLTPFHIPLWYLPDFIKAVSRKKADHIGTLYLDLYSEHWYDYAASLAISALQRLSATGSLRKVVLVTKKWCKDMNWRSEEDSFVLLARIQSDVQRVVSKHEVNVSLSVIECDPFDESMCVDCVEASSRRWAW